MMNLNKKAIELTINFLVMFILAMAMFATGIYLMTSIFNSAEEMKDRLSEQQRLQLEQILSNGAEPVKAIYVKKEIRPGEHEVFGLGIRNDLGYEETFFVEGKFDIFIDSKDVVQCDPEEGCDPVKVKKYQDMIEVNIDPANPEAYTIGNNEKEIIDNIFLFAPKDAEKGTYVYNIRVCYSGTENYVGCECPTNDVCKNQYSTTKKLNLVVI